MATGPSTGETATGGPSMEETTAGSLQHPCHGHGLIRRELSQYCRVLCRGCKHPVYGRTYCCLDCSIFLHESCAEAPLQILHPSHSQHSLTLDAEGDAFSYCCDHCSYSIQLADAVSTLPPRDQEVEEGKIKHFAHEHPLVSFGVSTLNWIACKVCGKGIFGQVYGCRACMFLLHESCARLSREIPKHPFHPVHRITLFADFNNLSSRCKACDKSHTFSYRCDECPFVLDAQCAVSTLPPRGHKWPEDESTAIKHFSHDHALTCFYVQKGNHILCKACGLDISGQVYGCPNCGFFLHKLCTEFPGEIEHFLHPQHPLKIQSVHLLQPNQPPNQRAKPNRKPIRCKCCSNNCSNFTFSCADCNFNLDPECALQTLAAYDAGVRDEIPDHFAHDHPLTLCYAPSRETQTPICNACKHHVEGLAYRCTHSECNFVLHRSCAELKQEWRDHPCHPQHKLLLEASNELETFDCSVCRRESNGFSFYCAECEFRMDIECATQKLTLKYARHEHVLTYIKQAMYLKCSICHKTCNYDVYRCVRCNYTLHRDCCYLPPTGRHSFHNWGKDLVLCDRYVNKDYAENEQYCDGCEDTDNPRNLDHGAYCCQDCPTSHAFHIDCVHPELKPKEVDPTEDPGLTKLKEEIAILEADIEEMKRNVAASERKAKALKIKKTKEFFTSGLDA